MNGCEEQTLNYEAGNKRVLESVVEELLLRVRRYPVRALRNDPIDPFPRELEEVCFGRLFDAQDRVRVGMSPAPALAQGLCVLEVVDGVFEAGPSQPEVELPTPHSRMGKATDLLLERGGAGTRALVRVLAQHSPVLGQHSPAFDGQHRG